MSSNFLLRWRTASTRATGASITYIARWGLCSSVICVASPTRRSPAVPCCSPKLPTTFMGALVPAPPLTVENRREHRLEICTALIVFKGVVARQKGTTVEELSFGELAPADDHRTICGVGELRPHLSGITGAQSDMLKRLLGCLDVVGQEELLAALESILCTCTIDDIAGSRKVALVRRRNAFNVVQLDGIRGCVVVSTDEPRVVRDVDAILLPEHHAY
eukprot:scaffold40021_cov30-Tisochrysis_lutea.AAC.2